MAAQLTDSDQSDVIASINITPFVDVMLVLLVIFLVTSTAIIRASIQVNLPQAAQGGQTVPSTLNLVLTQDGAWFLDGMPATPQSVGVWIDTKRQTKPNLQAVISADKQVAYGKVIAMIDLIKTHGVSQFALNIEKTPP